VEQSFYGFAVVFAIVFEPTAESRVPIAVLSRRQSLLFNDFDDTATPV
jgi:hypothetical protein